MFQCKAASAKGFTLVELLIVVAILAIILVIALPNISNNDANKVSLATSEVVSALRFAQSESLRTGDYHGLRLDTGTNVMRVFVLSNPLSSPAESYTVYHPLDKKLYDIDFANGNLTKGISASASFKYSAVTPIVQAVAFSPHGVPVSAEDLTPLPEGEGNMVVGLGSHSKTILLCADTGRVIVQQGSETCL